MSCCVLVCVFMLKCCRIRAFLSSNRVETNRLSFDLGFQWTSQNDLGDVGRIDTHDIADMNDGFGVSHLFFLNENLDFLGQGLLIENRLNGWLHDIIERAAR